ncbi:aminotransferase [Paraburkholderia caffeinilytica]|uniref:Aspartate aminotransferase family protein n=1 Tax=Paraburkholderia caffeinilytica TaxID=1761016 RepID=A0ABQ1LT43_9BURK|nr:aminotransferase [Paraburkholderia caffeinilytica]AXL53443.1 aminotransferase [Paraburkholderia caffeinilytica]GGC29515.1 aspartate aminotransferase family protein [Paraburkholderia caffeinilytica]CAB3781444.1 Putrescine--pyruvate aminotransferase [Paraburkholderia caffeinilytica]
MSTLNQLDIDHHLHPQTNLRQHEEVGPLIIESGDGPYVVDTDGNRYFEGMSGLWCASLGFSEKRLADAAHRQMSKLPYQQTFAHRSSRPVIELAARLLERAPVPMSKVMFQSSGSEAIDTAIKLVWYYQAASGRPGKRKIIGRRRGYHGTTVAAASLTGLPNMQTGWGLPLPDMLHVTCPHFYREGRAGETEQAFSARLVTELEQLILAEGAQNIGAFFAEPVMGTGGVVVPPQGYFEGVQAVLRKHDILFIVDEVICGFGRTGHYWGSQAFGLVPDMLACAKGLSSAYQPISALMLSDTLYQAIASQTNALGGFGHGFTYGGHPVAAAVALETLHLYDEYRILERVAATGALLQAGLHQLAEHPLVGEARGIGLMGALELVADKDTRAPFDPQLQVPKRVTDALQRRGFLLRALGASVLFAPPLISTPAQIGTLLAAVRECLDETVRGLHD